MVEFNHPVVRFDPITNHAFTYVDLGKAGEIIVVKSAERVAVALRFLAESPSGLLYSDLQRGLDLPKSSLHALLDTLVDTGFVTYDDASKRYALGPLVWELASAYSNKLQLVPLALPHLEKVSELFGETAQLAILEGAEVVYVAKVPSRRPIQLASNVGTRLPAYATGLGKALLACLSIEHIDRLYPNSELSPYTRDTVPTREALIQELAHVRQRGYATDRGEYSPGIMCVAVPILSIENTAKAALSVSIPAERYSDYDESQLVDAVTSEAYAIAKKLGALNPDGWRRQVAVTS